MEFKTGIFEDESGELIRNIEGWSKSSLDKVNQSMAHYIESKKNPEESSPSMIVGSALHCMVLTPHLYSSNFAIAPECNKRTNEGKAAWHKFLSDNADKEVLSGDDEETAKRMAESILMHPDASEMLTNGKPEVSLFWIDDKTGLKCKGKTDWLRNEGVIFDIKKSPDASFFYFQKKIPEYRYHVQAAYYLDGYHRITGKCANEFYFIVVEDHAPWAVAVYKVGLQTLDAGRRDYEANLKTILKYELTVPEERWAGYPRGGTVIEMSYWARQRSLPISNF